MRFPSEEASEVFGVQNFQYPESFCAPEAVRPPGSPGWKFWESSDGWRAQGRDPSEKAFAFRGDF